MSQANLEKLHASLGGLASNDQPSSFERLVFTDVEACTEKAALVIYEGYKKIRRHWLPFSQLRVENSEVYATKWILKQCNAKDDVGGLPSQGVITNVAAEIEAEEAAPAVELVKRPPPAFVEAALKGRAPATPPPKTQTYEDATDFGAWG